jgi:hypothetical protein
MNLSTEEKKLLDSSLEEIVKDAYAMSTGAIWIQIPYFIPNVAHQKDAFLYVLEQLLRQGKVKMGREHRLLDMSIEEVLQNFRDNWPSDEEFDDVFFCWVKPYEVPHEENLQTHLWTPGDLVWIDPNDGHELWSTDANY